MKLSTGLKVRVGKSQQPAVVVSNGFNVNYTRQADREQAKAHGNHHPDPTVMQSVRDMRDSGIQRSGFHHYPGNVAGYADVILANGQLARVSVKKIREYKPDGQSA